ncbi:hypothetical protein DL767_007438 [Monosporascus sp. MG133]|nr:hypothetical protein DL767_007438 [Monosporascus sp. MG133]
MATSTSSRLPLCMLSKTVDGADFVHVRLGLDEPPESLLCKCKTSKCMTSIPPPNVNPVVIKSMATRPNTEVEIRFERDSSKPMYDLASQGLFGHMRVTRIKESDCSWWASLSMNKNAGVVRPNGEMVVKIPLEVYKVAPRIVVAISYRHAYDIVLANTKVRVIIRKYEVVSKAVSGYAAEVEILERITYGDMRKLLREIVHTAGSTKRGLSRDKFMLKVYGVKVYVFCYTFGSGTNTPLYEMSKDPNTFDSGDDDGRDLGLPRRFVYGRERRTRFARGEVVRVVGGDMLPITNGSVNMAEGAIYELGVRKFNLPGYVTLTRPIKSISKVRPNNMDVVKDAFVSDDVEMNMMPFRYYVLVL